MNLYTKIADLLLTYGRVLKPNSVVKIRYGLEFSPVDTPALGSTWTAVITLILLEGEPVGENTEEWCGGTWTAQADDPNLVMSKLFQEICAELDAFTRRRRDDVVAIEEAIQTAHLEEGAEQIWQAGPSDAVPEVLPPT